MFGVSTSHADQVDLSIVANSEIVSSQADIDRLTKVYFPLEIESLQKRLKESNNNEFVLELKEWFRWSTRHLYYKFVNIL